jgi:hypothetical protein
MEVVETTLTPVQRRAGLTRVAWTDVAAQQRRRGEPVRVLAPGDDVLLDVDGHTAHRGRVLRYDGAGADGAYVITIGAPVARRAVARRPVAGNAVCDGVQPVVQDVVLRVVPAQRNTSVSLYL